MTIASAALWEFYKLATSEGDVVALCRELGVAWDDDPQFMDFCEDVTGKRKLSEMSSAELRTVMKELTKALGKKSLPKPPKIPKSLKATSDLVRAMNRKKMLLGVKREKAILTIDIMRRIRKKQRLALKPFRKLKAEQRRMRIGSVQDTRKQARRGYKSSH